jgi:hypothetical protein
MELEALKIKSLKEILYMNQTKEPKAHVVSKATGEIVTELYDGDSILRKESKEAHKKFEDAKNESKKASETLVWSMTNFMKMNTVEVRLWMDELSQAEKAFLFSIVPCVSFDDCHLQTHSGEDIGTEDLLKIVNMSRGLLYETIKSLAKKDIIYRGKNSKNRQYFVNPWLFCKGNRINKVLKTMFKNYKIKILGGKQWKDVKDKEDK